MFGMVVVVEPIQSGWAATVKYKLRVLSIEYHILYFPYLFNNEVISIFNEIKFP